MNHRARAVRSLLGAVMLCPTPTFAVHAPGRSALAAVPALDQPVTYTETKIPLGELVRKVAAATGVNLTASPEVADEPVAVVVQQLPARKLLDQLADLLDYRWTRRRRGGVWRYEIDQDYVADHSPGGETGVPACYGGPLLSDARDRRIIEAAVINCQSLGLSGSEQSKVPVAAFGNVVQTQKYRNCAASGVSK